MLLMAPSSPREVEEDNFLWSGSSCCSMCRGCTRQNKHSCLKISSQATYHLNTVPSILIKWDAGVAHIIQEEAESTSTQLHDRNRWWDRQPTGMINSPVNQGNCLLSVFACEGCKKQKRCMLTCACYLSAFHARRSNKTIQIPKHAHCVQQSWMKDGDSLKK